MKLDVAVAALAAAGLAAAHGGHEDQKPLRAEGAPADGTKSAPVALPSFTATKLSAPFVEQFTAGWDKRWKPSHAKKGNTDEGWAYVGEWKVEEPTVLKGMQGDEGLVVKDSAAHHAISAIFSKPLDVKGKPLVVQYEVKLQDGLDCGGAYLKLLRDTKNLHTEEFSNTTPYVIMFGPDKCGHTNKVHFIFNHKNPTTGEYEEKHLKSPASARIVKTTELYTLIVHPNNTFVVKQNNEEVKSGSLLEDFAPPVNPPAEIDDPKDSKPDDWVDEARMADPDASKPEDWDEDAPYEVEDLEAKRPDDWLVDEPRTVPDAEAAKPDDWDDEEDGDWIAPSVPNPKCEKASGCGPWTRPMKKNPAYKGKWTAPMIDNPAYKGVWAPRKIANPDFFEDKTPADLEPIGAIGFELWTMTANILFDNIYIGHSVEDADKLAKESFLPKLAAEKAQEAATKPKPDKGSALDVKFMEGPVAYVRAKGKLFLALAREDPINAVKFMPEFAGGLGAAAVVLLTVAYGVLSSLFSGPAKPSAAATAKKEEPAEAKAEKEEAKAGKDEAAKAVKETQATGADAGKTATKRAGKGQPSSSSS